ncbi:T9SS type B sorting domain-containing protein [Cellulophaga sp. F20128]|uniref:T9SS type B sorting domain-containing protein n=1 Tax=Cellulophaga sp. F20128 TaxID=2926413 RepID=UPI001FF1FF86|nr:T9SS type B sorting domain-containing protein [Cellulophaga sp. F20128]MCK0157772.1 T9SS type B sorting domain-containing protein [Cellulophaga sp. F20128]
MKLYMRLLVLSILLPLFSFSQSEASNWYFGEGAGLSFNGNGSVTAVTDGKLNTKEGCATISDSDGNLLFYTDGITVYTSTHDIMQNGTGLYGDPSSSQSALIVPNQKDTHIFYIFTVDTSLGGTDKDYGLNYSTVDLSLNAGAGAITQKNKNLLANCSEKITAVLKDCFEKSVWVIAYGSESGNTEIFDTFFAFEVNDTGVVMTPVINTFDSIAISDNRGYLKLSADGTKMAAANVKDGLYLYDFDASTGVLANQQHIAIRASNKDPYGVEFSPNNELLYVVAYNAVQGLDTESSNLLQFNLKAGDISASQVVLDERNIYRGALQLAENGKIYRSLAVSYDEGSRYLGVINNPNQLGTAAGYQHNAIYLNGKHATQGLPPFIQSFFAKTGLVKNSDGTTSTSLTVCEASPFILEATNIPGATYNWTHNGNPIANPNGSVFSVTQAALTDEGKYTLEIIPADPSECSIFGEAQLSINAMPVINNPTLTQCDLDTDSATASTDGYTAFNLEQASFDIANGVAGNKVAFYASEADRDADKPIANPIGFINTTATNQTLYTRVTNTLGCSSYGSLNLIVNPTTASISLPTNLPYYACDSDPNDGKETGYFDLDAIIASNFLGFDVSLYTSKEDASLEINAVSGANYSSETATIYVRLEAFNQCQGVEEISLNVQPIPKVIIEDEYYFCTDNPVLELTAENGFDSYEWYKTEANGQEVLVASTSTITLTEIGDYRLELGYSYRGGLQICTNSKNFKVTPSNIAIITNVEVKDIRKNNVITVLVSGDGDYEYAINDSIGPYQDSNVFSGLPVGFLDVYVRDKKGCGVTSPYKISIIGYPKMFTPNGDTANETWQISGLNEQFQPNSSIFIFDRYGVLISKITPTSAGWDGTHNGKPVPESDYWFRAKLEDGRDFNGHFSLKR